jgi:hypothetical protein
VQAGLDPCWSQTHYVGFVVTRLILVYNFIEHTEAVADHSPDGGKKRPRKSLPQRVVIEQDDLSESDMDGSVSVSSASWELDTSNTG